MSLPTAQDALGLYVHVPFCPRPCDFCAFFQAKPLREDVEGFLRGVAAERALYGQVRRADTFYLGGGTPGLLSTRDLESLCRALLAGLDAPPLEWTVELAPSTVKADKVAMLREMGVTRLSLGVQSFDEALLEKLGRPHRPEQAIRAYETARAEGFDNVNLDLIFAVPGQTAAMWERDLSRAIALGPSHLSTYCLTYEEDTPLWRRLARGEVARSLDDEADLYVRTWEFLVGEGYGQYEISNFCRPGLECLHNLHTWEMRSWIGLGPSAASQFQGRRFANPANLKQWLERVERGTPGGEDEVPLTPRLLAEDALIFGLRMSRGVRPDEIAARFGIDLSLLVPLWKCLETEGLLERRPPDRIALTLKGKLVADRVAVEILDAFEEGSA